MSSEASEYFQEVSAYFREESACFARELVSRTKQVSRNLGHYGNWGFTMILALNIQKSA